MTPKQAEEESRTFIDNLNSGNADAIGEICFRPFLFETEILISEGLISALWNGLIDAGYKIENPVVSEITECGPDTYHLFAETWEVQTYYSKYIPEEAFLVRITGGGDREILLLLNRDLREDYRIMATRVVR
jgi:hypothetical protein